MAEKSDGVAFGAEGARPVPEEWARGRPGEGVFVERTGPEGASRRTTHSGVPHE